MGENLQVQSTAFAKDLSNLDVLSVKASPIPEPGKGEVLCKILLAPVNPTDVHQLLGARPIGCREFPQVGGTEGLGKIVKCGPGVSKFKAGQRVVAVLWPGAFTGTGTWQQYLTAPEDLLVAVPDRLSDKAASQFVVNPLTAYGLIHTSGVPAGVWLLQTGAGSVLGRQLIILARRQGIKTINVVRRSSQKQELLELGADEVIGTDKEDVAQRVKEITGGKGAYASVDAVSGDGFEAVVAATRYGGQIIAYGSLSGHPCKVSSLDLLYNVKRVTGFLLGVWLGSLGTLKQAVLNEVMTMLADKVIEPLSGDVYPLKDVAKAVMDSQKAGRGGKLFLQP
ncbi:hypothetical protein WJX84_004905 [Apatococcus fuscideae]|uniref:Enoyl reductase (ER) domain-containing protein n=1 Tax=Apatococcus fuscideae TaxID=2026836 RepID=A0AAW1SIL5_9CHLO